MADIFSALGRSNWWEDYNPDGEGAAAAEAAQPETPPEPEKPKGPSQAMRLAERYIAAGSLEALSAAIPLLQQESDAGNLDAARKGAEVSARLGLYFESQDAYPAALEVWSSALQFLTVLSNQPRDGDTGEDEKTRQEDARMLERALYGIATCYWSTGNHKAVIQYLSPIENRDAKSTTLLALSRACTARGAQDVPYIMALFASVFESKDYVSAKSVGKAGRMEQVIFATAARTYADWIMRGAGGIGRDKNTAQTIIKQAFYAITDPTAQKVLTERS